MLVCLAYVEALLEEGSLMERGFSDEVFAEGGFAEGGFIEGELLDNEFVEGEPKMCNIYRSRLVASPSIKSNGVNVIPYDI
jgi:hypothetical protein